MRGFSSETWDSIIGWVSAAGLVAAIGATAYGYGVQVGEKRARTIVLPQGAVCRIDADGSRLCRTPHVSEYSREEQMRINAYRRKVI